MSKEVRLTLNGRPVAIEPAPGGLPITYPLTTLVHHVLGCQETAKNFKHPAFELIAVNDEFFIHTAVEAFVYLLRNPDKVQCRRVKFAEGSVVPLA